MVVVLVVVRDLGVVGGGAVCWSPSDLGCLVTHTRNFYLLPSLKLFPEGSLYGPINRKFRSQKLQIFLLTLWASITPGYNKLH